MVENMEVHPNTWRSKRLQVGASWRRDKYGGKYEGAPKHLKRDPKDYK